MPDRTHALIALHRKLNSIGHLSEPDRQVLNALPIIFRTLAREEDVVREGERPTQCCILLSGWTFRQKSFAEGRSQYLALHLPGDIIDLQSFNLPVMDHTLTALTSIEVGCISHAHLRHLLDQRPSLNSILWRSTLIEAATTRQWLLNLGRLNAVERIAHLFCETYSRLAAIGLCYEAEGKPMFQFPLTQDQLGQAVGLTAVHVNRSIQELRARNLIKSASGFVTILDWTGLKALANFNASYLGLLQALNEAA